MKAMVIDSESPLLRLPADDLAMICTFVLLSGSVKDLAESYGVSYPTMRARLDSVIARLRQLADGAPLDPVNDYLSDLIAKGRIATPDANRIRELHRQSLIEQRTVSTQEKKT